MKIISENIHIISKTIKEAIEDRDDLFLRKAIRKIYLSGVDYIDLNIGPAKSKLENSMPWLVELAQAESHLPFSFDSTNPDEIVKGLIVSRSPSDCIVNSATGEEKRLETMTDIASSFESFLICLTLDEKGIPSTADERLEIVEKMLQKCEQKGVKKEKIMIDPLVLPVGVNQRGIEETLNTLRMVKEVYNCEIETVVGLSNISNGAAANAKPWLNRVFAVLAMGAGLDNLIVNSEDTELLRILASLKILTPELPVDKLYHRLYQMMREFESINEVIYDIENEEECNIYKTAKIILNKEVYSPSYMYGGNYV